MSPFQHLPPCLCPTDPAVWVLWESDSSGVHLWPYQLCKYGTFALFLIWCPPPTRASRSSAAPRAAGRSGRGAQLAQGSSPAFPEGQDPAPREAPGASPTDVSALGLQTWGRQGQHFVRYPNPKYGSLQLQQKSVYRTSLADNWKFLLSFFYLTLFRYKLVTQSSRNNTSLIRLNKHTYGWSKAEELF